MAEERAVGFAKKGFQDTSWPTCPNCGGFGTITQELAIGGAKGLKGDPCEQCHGVGRVHDPKWPSCPDCGLSPDPLCQVCGGLGLLSPERAALLARGAIMVTCKGCNGAGAVPFRPPKPAQPAAKS
jgi:DnaJ-class molecular chaperone